MPRNDGTPYASEVGAENLGKVWLVLENHQDDREVKAVFLSEDKLTTWLDGELPYIAAHGWYVEVWKDNQHLYNLDIVRKPGPIETRRST